MSTPLVAFNGYYLAQRIRCLSIPALETYSRTVSKYVLTAFSDLEKRADEVAHETYERAGSTLPWDSSTSEWDLAESAYNAELDFYLVMTDFRQATVNLLAVGLFHLIEQQLHYIARDGLFSSLPRLRDTKLSVAANWYEECLGIDLQKYQGWELINGEMRLLANTIKHGDGNSAKELRNLKPELFRSPFTIDDGISTLLKNLPPPPIGMPLNGEGVYVPDELIGQYGNTAINFLDEWASDLQKVADEFHKSSNS